MKRRQGRSQVGDKVGDKWERSGKTQKNGETWFYLEAARRHKGSKQQRQTRSTNENMLKLEQDTATKADIWSETNEVGDRWWETDDDKAIKPDTTTKADPWLETN